VGGDETEAISDFLPQRAAEVEGLLPRVAEREQDVISGENVRIAVDERNELK
jgi:hypothetical protein